MDESDARASMLTEMAGMYSRINSVLESQLSFDTLIDPRERFMVNGQMWQPVGTNGPLITEDEVDVVPYQNEDELKHVRAIGRWLWRENPFAKAGHTNRENYIVGYGTTYTITAKPDVELEPSSITRVQDVVDAFVERNRWHLRQPEIVTRRDRDGECILRKWRTDDGITVRFVESAALFTPTEQAGKANIKYGIETLDDGERQDTETPVAYWINGKPVEAAEIQHRRRGDSLAVRGVPIFWTARRHLVSAQKILRNGSAITELQTAIGMIRKFMKAQKTTIQSWAASSANVAVTNNAPGYGTAVTGTTLHQQFAPGTIINGNGDTEYEFPSMGVDPSKYIDSLQAELRAAAASVCMSESMFSAKTDDVNRASALVAEGPVTKNFERLQYDEAAWDKELLYEELDYAVERGVITQSERDGIKITVGPPTLVPRDRKLDAETRKIDMAAGILSLQTATTEAGYSYQEEQANIDAHQERNGGSALTIPLGTLPDPDVTTTSTTDTVSGDGSQESTTITMAEMQDMLDRLQKLESQVKSQLVGAAI